MIPVGRGPGSLGWSWEAAGKEGGGGGAGSLVLGALRARAPGGLSPLQPKHMLMHLLWTHGWSGDRHPGPLPALHWGGSLESGRLSFTSGLSRFSSGTLVPSPGWAWTSSSLSCPQAPLAGRRLPGGTRPLRAAPLEERSHRAPHTQRWRGQHRPWPQTEPDGPQPCDGDSLSPLGRLLLQASPQHLHPSRTEL